MVHPVVDSSVGAEAEYWVTQEGLTLNRVFPVASKQAENNAFQV